MFHQAIFFFVRNFSFSFTGQEENVYAKRNYEKYLSALKNSGLVSVEDKGLSGAGAGAADPSAGAGTGALGLLGNFSFICRLEFLPILLH